MSSSTSGTTPGPASGVPETAGATPVDLRMVAPLAPSPVPAGFLDGAGSLTDAFAALVERWPDWECMSIVDRDRLERRVRLGALWQRAGDVAAVLAAHGLRRGDVVVLVLPTGPEIVAAYFGVMLAGGVPALVATPSNRLADTGVYVRRVSLILANARARALYADPEIGALFAAAPALLAGATLLVPADVPRADRVPAPPNAGPADLATVQYSSGSTGTPKGVLLRHGAMLNNIRAVRDGLGMRPEDPSVNWIPLYHDMGLIDAFLLPLLNGSPTVLIPTLDFVREPALWLWAVHRYRGALSWAPNFAYAFCADRVPDGDVDGLDLSSWRIAINAAEPVLAHTIEGFTRRYLAHGFRPEAMTPAWGLAENVTIATAHPVGAPPRIETVDRQALAAEHVARPTTGAGLVSVAIGRCLPGCAVEIRDASGRPAPERHIGTVWLRSDSLFTGYHHDAAATARALVDGWLDTGDQGYVAGDDLFFVGREKDLIVVGGDKYAPHDLENAVNSVPGVRAGCAVAFGVLDEDRGTEDVAVVAETHVTAPDERAALDRAIREAVTRATGLGVRHLLLVPAGGIEKTSSGKLARRATRQRHAEALGIPA